MLVLLLLEVREAAKSRTDPDPAIDKPPHAAARAPLPLGTSRGGAPTSPLPPCASSAPSPSPPQSALPSPPSENDTAWRGKPFAGDALWVVVAVCLASGAGDSGVDSSGDFPRNEMGVSGPAPNVEAGVASGELCCCCGCWARWGRWISSRHGLETEDALLALLGELTTSGSFWVSLSFAGSSVGALLRRIHPEG